LIRTASDPSSGPRGSSMGVTSFLLTGGVLPDGLPDQWE
jgi:hypothetical protein